MPRGAKRIVPPATSESLGFGVTSSPHPPSSPFVCRGTPLSSTRTSFCSPCARGCALSTWICPQAVPDPPIDADKLATTKAQIKEGKELMRQQKGEQKQTKLVSSDAACRRKNQRRRSKPQRGWGRDSPPSPPAAAAAAAVLVGAPGCEGRTPRALPLALEPAPIKEARALPPSRQAPPPDVAHHGGHRAL